MDFELSDGTSLRLVAPFADMLNHSPDVKPCHVCDPSSRSLSILAGKNYEAGDQVRTFCSPPALFRCLLRNACPPQVFINYGPKPNSRLLRLYGFILPGNPNDNYDLVLATHPEAPLFEQKRKLWELAGLDSASTISLTLTDPLPLDVLRYLRIQRSSESELATMALHQTSAAERISHSNEVEVLRFLVDSFRGLLDGFGTQLERLEKQLADGVHPSGGNAWAAAHVSLGEQRVLRLARKRAEDLLSAAESQRGEENTGSPVPTQCANCGKDSVPLKLCGRCKSVVYCGRTCQVAHFGKHKAPCRTAAARVI